MKEESSSDETSKKINPSIILSLVNRIYSSWSNIGIIRDAKLVARGREDVAFFPLSTINISFGVSLGTGKVREIFKVRKISFFSKLSESPRSVRILKVTLLITAPGSLDLVLPFDGEPGFRSSQTKNIQY